jgi:hypothetical protein
MGRLARRVTDDFDRQSAMDAGGVGALRGKSAADATGIDATTAAATINATDNALNAATADRQMTPIMRAPRRPQR